MIEICRNFTFLPSTFNDNLFNKSDFFLKFICYYMYIRDFITDLYSRGFFFFIIDKIKYSSIILNLLFKIFVKDGSIRYSLSKTLSKFETNFMERKHIISEVFVDWAGPSVSATSCRMFKSSSRTCRLILFTNIFIPIVYTRSSISDPRVSRL